MVPRTPARAAEAASASANQVFDTYELLENILLHLPITDLFLSQRVSRQWQSLVKQSSRLQQALFLQPGPPLVCWQRQQNRLLTKVTDTSRTYAAMQPDDSPVDFDSSTTLGYDYPWCSDGRNNEVDYTQVSYKDASGSWYQGQRSRRSDLLWDAIMIGAVPNTLLFPDAFTYKYQDITRTFYGNWARSQSLHLRIRDGNEGAAAWLKATSPTASMFLTQPPATRVRWQFLTDEGGGRGCGVMARAEGIRVEDILRFLRDSAFARNTAVKVCVLGPVGMLFPTADELTMAQIPAVLDSPTEQDTES